MSLNYLLKIFNKPTSIQNILIVGVIDYQPALFPLSYNKPYFIAQLSNGLRYLVYANDLNYLNKLIGYVVPLSYYKIDVDKVSFVPLP